VKIHANQKWKTDLVKIGRKQSYKNWRETNLKNGWAGTNFQGRVVPQAAPGKGFSGAAKGTSRPWKTHFQGRVRALPAPENPFSGAANALTRPLKTHLQGRALYLPLEISICSSERQGRVSCPPLKMLFYPPLQTVFVVVTLNSECPE